LGPGSRLDPGLAEGRLFEEENTEKDEDEGEEAKGVLCCGHDGTLSFDLVLV
jgi:hypothetical protein